MCKFVAKHKPKCPASGLQLYIFGEWVDATCDCPPNPKIPKEDICSCGHGFKNKIHAPLKWKTKYFTGWRTECGEKPHNSSELVCGTGLCTRL